MVLLIISTVVLQTLTRYYSRSFLIWTSFDTFKFLLTLIVPVIIGRYWIFDSFSEMGLGAPRLKPTEWLTLIMLAILIPVVMGIISHREEYLQYYQLYRQTQTPAEDRIYRFSLFAISTITGWEMIHRGFLLSGLRKLFASWRMPDFTVSLLSILWVMSFEVIYHFVKPDLETWGMLIFSPIASYIAIRSKSIWPSMILHLWIETFFILMLTGTFSTGI